VVGGGYGGATVAKYLRMWSEGGVQVTLIERNPTFISCPISNLVIGGTKTMEDITISYDGLRRTNGACASSRMTLSPSMLRKRLNKIGSRAATP
jgi:NADH dehydrogenase FAD-containing subunit